MEGSLGLAPAQRPPALELREPLRPEGPQGEGEWHDALPLAPEWVPKGGMLLRTSAPHRYRTMADFVFLTLSRPYLR